MALWHLLLRPTDELQELIPRLGVVTENSQHGAGDRLGVCLLHASHHHAHVTVREGNGWSSEETPRQVRAVTTSQATEDTAPRHPYRTVTEMQKC